MVKGGSTTALCLSVISFLFMPAIERQQDGRIRSASLPVFESSNARSATLTCDRDAIDRESYEMATIGQARALRELNLDAQELAERAFARDPRNMMAHSILARQYTILGWDRQAVESWGRVVREGCRMVINEERKRKNE